MVQELVLQRREHARFDLVAADGEVVVAASLIAGSEAAEPMPARHDESRSADAAFRQTREQVLRTSRADRIAGGPDGSSAGLLALLRIRPQLVGYDAQLRHVLPHPLGFRIEPRDALSRLWVLHVAQAVPDEPTNVEIVVKDPASALGVSVDSARAPGAAERTRDAFSIEALGDPLRRDAGDEVAEDSLDNRRFGRLDPPLACGDASAVQRLDDSIPVAQAAGRLAVLDSPTQSAVRLLGEILQEQGVHRALESNVQVRDVAFGKRDDVDAGKGQSFEQARGVFLIAAESVERLGEHDVEPVVQRIAHQRLETRAEKRCAGDSVVRVLVRDRPALSLSERAADPELIRDGRVALIVGGVSRVDPDFHDFTSMDAERVAAQFGFEDFARRLPRESSHEHAECVVAWRVDLSGCNASSDRRNTSRSPSAFASSFGHDTPAHVGRRLLFAGVRADDEWAALSAAPNALYLVSSAEGVFGAVIARDNSQRDRIKNLSESGCCRNDALEHHSEALHTGRCGGRAVRHEMF